MWNDALQKQSWDREEVVETASASVDEIASAMVSREEEQVEHDDRTSEDPRLRLMWLQRERPSRRTALDNSGVTWKSKIKMNTKM